MNWIYSILDIVNFLLHRLSYLVSKISSREKFFIITNSKQNNNILYFYEFSQVVLSRKIENYINISLQALRTYKCFSRDNPIVVFVFCLYILMVSFHQFYYLI